MNKNISEGYAKYLQKKKLNKIIILTCQIGILLIVLSLWEILAHFKIIDTFIMSSPSRIIKTIKDLYLSGTLFKHTLTTLYEAIIGFTLATIGGTLIAIILWWNDTVRKILDPYIVVLNSLPKIALGPLIIIWVGVGTSSIVTMDILIMIIIDFL